jgi:hypothetical protein
MAVYDDDLLVKEAREQYFKRSGFDETSYSTNWVRFGIGPLAFYIPNLPARKRAAPLHDLHHIATGYDTTWAGEAEVSAWELASGGCGRHTIAWLFVLSGALLGCFISPRRVVRAWNRGTGSRNLFDREFSEEILSQTVGSLRSQLQIRPV